MKRIYHPYNIWEDFLNGMYEIPSIDFDEELIKKGIEVLSNQELFFQVGLSILEEWKISSDVNLSNTGCNRKAWLGQAACNYKYKIPELITREVWSRLTDEQRNEANDTADRIIKIYEASYRGVH